jgi:hypothetical protein
MQTSPEPDFDALCGAACAGCTAFAGTDSSFSTGTSSGASENLSVPPDHELDAGPELAGDSVLDGGPALDPGPPTSRRLNGKCPAVIFPSGASAIALSIQCSSSLTFPGHVCDRIDRSASASNRGAGRS